MKRLLTIAIALVAMTTIASPAQAGFGSSPGPRGQEMDHGSNWGEWIADVERPRRP